MRERDVRRGAGPLLKGDVAASLPHLWQFATHPRWVMDYLADGAPRVFPNVELPGVGAMPCSDTSVLLAETNATWKDLAWIRDAWGGPLVVRRRRDDGALEGPIPDHFPGALEGPRDDDVEPIGGLLDASPGRQRGA